MTRPPSVCAQPGCPALVPAGQGRCPQHKRPAWQGGQNGTHSTTWAWQKTRRVILERDHHTCRHCGQPATDIDHIVPRSKGGTDRPTNLTSLCRACHTAKTIDDRKDRR